MSIQYGEYDENSLVPLNQETRIRANELEILNNLVKGKTVLDIGCNKGYASILAVKHGATKVTSTDVVDSELEFFRHVIRKHNLPIYVDHISFAEMRSSIYKSDVVFCFEVIHWLCHQGLSVKNILGKLNELTKTHLFIETPWSKKDPSILKYSGTPIDHYSLKDVIQGLIELKFEVKILYFTKYFANPHERIMLHAVKRK